MQKILLIDVDGTLIDSYPGIRESFIEGLEAVGARVPGEDVLRHIPGPPMIENYRDLGLEGEDLRTAMDTYISSQRSGAWKNCEVFPGIPELLRTWRDEGFILATATSKAESSAQRVLEHFDLFGYFHVLGAAEEADKPGRSRQKKDDVIEHTLGLLRDVEGAPLVGGEVDPSQVLMIGDRKHDLEGAKKFGIQAALVTWGYGSEEEHAAAPFTARDAEELGGVVNEFSQGTNTHAAGTPAAVTRVTAG
ncbi:HAD hydrolase-like protein [Corynebacterium heidelbergense]|uniref:Phosphoglycolate phosphatase n=1 Tax=Corynebacterium heidelbergense TaxID=2055947 RepID=A0A364V5L5_9CORY|nr:HAD hydrolase-like protein [Corynebacterium heidelbergense]RAV31908.1 phosphoglycolate phosphatase [Corynebacterium heidelbergense]